MADARAQAASPAVDFLAMLASETELYETHGVTVELRTLTFTEVQNIATRNRGNETETAFQALRLGLKSPDLSDEQWQQVRSGKAGPLMEIATRVMTISGMAQKEGSSPLDGDGSLPTAAAQTI